MSPEHYALLLRFFAWYMLAYFTLIALVPGANPVLVFIRTLREQS